MPKSAAANRASVAPIVTQRARIASARKLRKARMIGPGSSACAVFGFLSIQTPSMGVNSAATHHDAISAMPTTAKIEKVYSPAALRAKPMGTNAAIVTSVPASLGKAVEL